MAQQAMTKSGRGFQQLAGLSAILLAAFVVGNVLTLFASLGNDPAAFSDAPLLLSMDAARARLFHMSMVLDVLAYLAFAPIAVFCWLWLRRRGQGSVALFTFGGLAYSLLGALGGVVVDAVIPMLAADYTGASVTLRETLVVAARTAHQAVAHGVWNPLEVLLVSVWFIGVGLSIRHDKRGLGYLALLVGLLGLLDPIGWALGNHTILDIGALSTVLILVWSLWFGTDVLRGPLLIGE